MNEFSVDAFMKGLDEDKVINKGPSDRITKILMNTKDNQGTIMFVPFMNKKTNNFYLKLSIVKEWNGRTTKFDTAEVWYKILPEEYYENLSQENQDLLVEINGLFKSIEELGVFSYDKIRTRNYTLIYGVLLSHSGTEGNLITTNVDKPCLFIFPSHSPITAIADATASKCQALKGDRLWLTKVLSPNNTGRTGVMLITFRKSQKGGGYDSSVLFEGNSELNTFIDPNRVFEESITKHFNDPIRDFLGWQGNGESGYFNTEIMKELRDDLKNEFLKIQAERKIAPEPVYENKNGNQDPMKNTQPAAATIATVSMPSVTPVYETVNETNSKSTDFPF